VIRVGLIGYGYWGPNLARNFAADPGAQLVGIADLDPERRAKARRDYPSADVRTEADDVIKADVDAVVIAAPASEHERLAMDALAHGRHVLVEKPFAASAERARVIAAAASAAGRVLMVDHTLVYAPALDLVADLLATQPFGPPLYLEATRTNLARFDPEVGVVRDLATHDLSILSRLLGRQPSVVSAQGALPSAGEPEDLAFISLAYADGLLARIHVDCVSPVKIRSLLVGGRSGLILWNDIEPVEKVRLYRAAAAGATDGDLRTSFRAGSVDAPALSSAEPLSRMAAHFLRCVRTGEPPLTGGAFAADVLAIVEAVHRSLAAGGAPERL
jgi:predicted dehydrogenase